MLRDEFLDQALQVAREAAQNAERVIAKYYRSGVAVHAKADASPVTIADQEAEAVIIATLREHFPEHAFYGEESGSHGESEWLWLIDPIDGTKAFVREYPLFSTQIALMWQGELVLGVSSAAQFGHEAFARKGGGAFLNGVRLRANHERSLPQAQLSFGNIKTLMADDKRLPALRQVWSGANRVRGYGDFLHYHWLAQGAVDAVIESDVNILDIAALAVIVREAGGRFTQLDGSPLDLETRSVLAAGADLHQDLLTRFSTGAP
jgi:histidinol-phosphatase